MGILKLLIDNLRKGPATDAFPFGPATTPAAYRGKVEIDDAACVACKMCEHVCAGGAIRFTEDAEGMNFLIWHNSCVSCGPLRGLLPDQGNQADHKLAPVPSSGGQIQTG